jgi:hypothetical protein
MAAPSSPPYHRLTLFLALALALHLASLAAAHNVQASIALFDRPSCMGPSPASIVLPDNGTCVRSGTGAIRVDCVKSTFTVCADGACSGCAEPVPFLPNACTDISPKTLFDATTTSAAAIVVQCGRHGQDIVAEQAQSLVPGQVQTRFYASRGCAPSSRISSILTSSDSCTRAAGPLGNNLHFRAVCPRTSNGTAGTVFICSSSKENGGGECSGGCPFAIPFVVGQCVDAPTGAAAGSLDVVCAPVAG